jgi:hypothetical protein
MARFSFAPNEEAVTGCLPGGVDPAGNESGEKAISDE